MATDIISKIYLMDEGDSLETISMEPGRNPLAATINY
jgi:hypothetical protein